jgi:hypothetical protein
MNDRVSTHSSGAQLIGAQLIGAIVGILLLRALSTEEVT